MLNTSTTTINGSLPDEKARYIAKEVSQIGNAGFTAMQTSSPKSK